MIVNRLLITGAAGALGKMLRAGLAGEYPVLRLSSRRDMGPAAAGEELARCDLCDAPAVDALLDGVDAVVHLGGQSVEADWETVLQSNIIGAYNLWEAARKAGTKRIIFASSNHASGFYRRAARTDHTAPARPDSRYGLSKAFGEDLGRLYADKHGVSCMCIRIGSCRETPLDERMLATWQSPRDFVQQIKSALAADYHFEIVYGVSNNDRNWWDNANALRLGYRPRDNAEPLFAAAMAGKVSDNPVTETFVGGAFAAAEFSGDIEAID